MNENVARPKVSVVMPVYNTAPYLEEALGSIAAQTLREIEILAVDDGSTDGSPGILERMAARDGRIRVFTQANAGSSVARNTALDRARGEFIYFMDSDDRLDADALECCYAKCVSDELDLLFFDADSFSESPELDLKENHIRAGRLEDRTRTGMETLRNLLAVRGYSVAIWTHFTRRSYLERIGLRFYPGILHQDELFTPLLYIPAGRVGRIERTFFHRRYRPGSVMTSAFSWRDANDCLVVLEQMQACRRHAGGGEERRMMHCLMARMLKGTVRRARVLPHAGRMRLLRIVLRRYPALISPKYYFLLAAGRRQAHPTS